MGECFREKENQKQGQESKSQEEIAIREDKIQEVAPCGKGGTTGTFNQKTGVENCENRIRLLLGLKLHAAGREPGKKST